MSGRRKARTAEWIIASSLPTLLLEYSGGAWSSTGSAACTQRRDELDFHGFSPDTQHVTCGMPPCDWPRRRCAAAPRPTSDWTRLGRNHDRPGGTDRTRADRNSRAEQRRSTAPGICGSRPVRVGAARHRRNGLPPSDADPGAGDPVRADGTRRAGRGADRHRQDRRLHLAAARHPDRLARAGTHAAQPDPGADARARAAGRREFRPVRQVSEADPRAGHRRREHDRPARRADARRRCADRHARPPDRHVRARLHPAVATSRSW